MTSNQLQPSDLMDIFNESDASDEDFAACSHFGLPIEDLRHEIDIARYYRRLCTDFSCNNSKTSRWTKKSKSVQTEPDNKNIPPSWLLHGERLVDELYTGLGNIINSLYHMPNSFNEETLSEEDNIKYKQNKYFTYENGYWQSTLLPGIRIPADKKSGNENGALFSEDLKKKLNYLLEIATKLRNVEFGSSTLSCISGMKTVENGKKCYSNKYAFSADVESSNRDVCNLCSDIHDPIKSSEYCTNEKILSQCTKGSNRVSPTKKYGENSISSKAPGVVISKYCLLPRACTVSEKSIQGVTNGRKVCKMGKSGFSVPKGSGLIIVGEISKSKINPSTSVHKVSREGSSKWNCGSIETEPKNNKVKYANKGDLNKQQKEKRTHLNQENSSSDRSDHQNRSHNIIKRNILSCKLPSNHVAFGTTIRNSKCDAANRENEQERSHKCHSQRSVKK